MGILKKLRRLWSTFTPLEERLLAAVEERLEPAAAELFGRQMEAVNKVQRLGEGREVNLYRMRGGKPRKPPELAFPDQRREVELAVVRFRVPGEMKLRKVTLFLVDGFVFTLIFQPGAEEVLDQDEVAVEEVRIEIDPMRSQSPVTAPGPRDAKNLSGPLEAWNRKYGVTRVAAPLDGEARRRRLREIPVELPADYLRLTEQADGFVLEPWTVFGLAEVYGISPDEHDYQVLAELRDEGVLAVEESTSSLFFVPFDDGARRPIARFQDEIDSAVRLREVS